MYDLVKKNSFKLLVGLISIMILFLGLTFLVRKENKSLTERQRRLMRYDQVQDGDEAIVGTDYITFDAFFLEDLDNDGNAEGIRGSEIEIGKADKLYLELKVLGDVKLTNGKITFENSNSRVAGTIKKGSLVSTNQESSNFSTITLRDEVSNGLTVTKPLNVYANLTNDIRSYTGVNKVILTGTVTDLNGNKIADIEKEVSYTVDWYGDKLNANVSGNGTFNKIQPNTNPVVNYSITTSETAGQMFLKTFYMEGTISQLNDRDPLSVNISGSGITYTYDETTRKFTIRRDATLEGTLITNQAYAYKNDLVKYNDVSIRVTYPYDESDEEGFTSVSVTSWYDAFNNDGGNIDDVKTSNKASRIITASFVNQRPGGPLPVDHRSSLSIGRHSSVLNRYYIDKTEATSIYNGAEIENSVERYGVSWNIYVPSVVNDENKGGNTYTLKFTDLGGDKLNNSLSMKDYVTYKTISFSNVSNALNSNGTITLINADTDETIHVFTALDWNDVYTFEDEVRSIKLEVNGFNYINYAYDSNNYRYQLSFSVYASKAINNNKIVENIPYEDFETYGSITSQFDMRVYKGAELVQYDGRSVNTFGGTASYVNAQSQAYLSVNKSQIYTTEESTAQFVITTNDIDDISRGFKDGEYFILLPEEILGATIIDVTPDSNKISIVGSSVGTLEDGRKYIKVLTSNTDIVKYKITINVKLLPDPRKTDKGIYYYLYAYNPNCHNYRSSTTDVFDINGNNDYNEKVSYAYATMSISAPNEMLTTSILTNYDASGGTMVAPLIAEVNPVEDDSEATVEIGLTNNSDNGVKNIKVIGKIAYEANTYQIGEGDLGSEYNVHMTDDGITVPAELADDAKVYYSEKETPSTDLSDPNNGWTSKDNTDFTKVKSYMIVIDSYIMPVKKSLTFTYDVDMPIVTDNLNKVTYFTHGVYYDLITENGLHSATVGGSKLGIRMSRQYNLNLTNLKPYSNRPVKGSKYILTDEDGLQTIISTDTDGNAIVKDLYVDKEYTLKQISTPIPYVVDEETKTFKVINGDNDELSIQSNGTLKSITLNNTKELVVEHESETRYTVVLKNTDLNTDEAIEGAAFKLTGKGYEDGAILTTNENGEYTLKNLYINERYTIDQIRNIGYLKLKESFTIDIIRDNNTGEVKITLKRVPTVTRISGRMVSNFCGYEYNSNNDNYQIEYWNCQNYQGRYIYGYFTVDLTGMEAQYELSFDPYWQDSTRNSYMHAWIMDDKNLFPDPYSPDLALPTLTIGSSEYNDNNIVSGTYSTRQVSKYDADTGTWHNEDFMGGQKYDVILFFKKGTSYDYHKVSNIKIKTLDGLDEQVAQSEKTNVPLDDNQNVLQSIQDSDNQDSPVLTIDIKSVKIPTYTLEITKEDAETGNPLAGAQYKVTGPGLPATGKYITTNEEGKASIELYKKYNYNIINDVNYSEIENLYTIQEVVAPIGYMIDSKSIEFKGQQMLSGCSDNATYTGFNCDMSQENVTFIQYESDGQFKEYTFDATTNTIKAKLQDYPIVKITKKDAETGTALPNTLFAVYTVSTIGGVQVETPAVDPNGNVLGTEIEIDGRTYRVVKTDANGNLNLNLPAGQYKLKEVQAADDKYEVDTAVYYFGVGETVPYQEAGINLVGSTLRKDVNFSGYQPKMNFIGLDGSHFASDGGYIGRDGEYIVKYDADGNVEWSTSSSVPIYGYIYYLSYYDRPGEVKRYCSPTNIDGPDTENCQKSYFTPGDTGSMKVIEVEDGYYAALGGGSQFYMVIKLDKQGNIVWQSTEAAYTYRYFYYGIVDEAVEPTDYLYRDENTRYYTSYSISYYIDTLFDKIGDIAVDADGNLLIFVGYIYNDTYHYNNELFEHGVNVGTIEFDSHYSGFRFPDGTYYFPSPEYSSSQSSLLLKYDKDGNLFDIVDYNQKMQEGLEKYLADNNLTGTYSISPSPYPQYTVVRTYDDGSILFKMYANSLYYTFETENGTNSWSGWTSFYVKMDKDNNVIFLAPVAMNGSEYYLQNNYQGTEPVFVNNETGGFTLVIPYFSLWDTNNYILCQNGYANYDSCNNSGLYDFFNVSHVDLPTYHDMGYNGLELLRTSSFILEYDGNGKVVKATPYMSHYGSDLGELLYGDNFYGMLQGETNAAIYKMNDGYIVAADLHYVSSAKVRLKSGEMRKITETDRDNGKLTSVVYKVDFEGNIEWLRELHGNSYTNNSNNYYTLAGLTDGNTHATLYFPEITTDDEGHLIIPYRLSPHSHVTDPVSGVTIENDADYNQWAYLQFELSNEVSPSGPEAYTLNIENKRKEYKVTATSNDGGDITVTNPNNGQTVAATDGDLTTLETVKYGDNNIYDIKIKPRAGFVIKSVTVNNEEIGYKVNDDYSITLNKIEDIRENKNIKVTYDENLSTVIVKHYLKNTTTSVFSDEIITGQVTKPYSVNAQSSDLYSVATDINGEAILPDNMEGNFTAEPITVIFYYVENEVELTTNYYIDGTDTELSPSNVERKVIGSPYQTSPLAIPHYEVTKVLGETSGTLNRNTEVTYMYQMLTDSKITVRYVDKATNEDIIEPVIIRVPNGDDYTTEQSLNIPAYYEYDSSTPNTSGPANSDEITVIYYYNKLESTITIKYVDKDTNLDIIEPITKKVQKYSSYTTDDAVTLPTNYRFTNNVYGNPSGTADENNILVVYYYEVIPFNISVDKKINSVLLNGEKQNITNGKNITISPFKKDNLIVYYEIDVENTGEIKATFKVVEKEIPGFDIYDIGEFTKVGNNYELNVELEPGEKKTYKIAYKWNQKDYGISVNEVELKEVTNENGFDEPDGTDNISTAKVETTIPEDVLDDKVIIPNTVDKIATSIILLITSFVGMISMLILTRKKRMN